MTTSNSGRVKETTIRQDLVMKYIKYLARERNSSGNFSSKFAEMSG